MSRPSRRLVGLVAAASLGGVVLAGCAAVPDNAKGVASWKSAATFSQSTSYLRSDLRDIANGIAERQLQATQTACDGLASDAATATGELPTPDERATNELNSAYTDFVNGAQDCSSARSFGGTGFSRYERLTEHGRRLLDEAIARLADVEHPKDRTAG